MDKVYELDKKPWISKKTLILSDLIEKRKNELSENDVLLQEPIEGFNELIEELQSFMENNDEAVKSAFHFNTDDEKTLVIDPECNLVTYEKQLDHAKKLVSSRAYRIEYLSQLQTTRKEVLMRHLASVNHNRPEHQVTSNLFKARNKSFVTLIEVRIWAQPASNLKIKLEKEVIFRADDSLVELRNQIKCHVDYGVPIDLSENPEKTERILRGELYKSAFFLIGDSFYNDMRDVNNEDLSQNIIQWASKPVALLDDYGHNVIVDRGIGPFKRFKMEQTKFRDVQFRLGCPYLYLHQGTCEHIFTINDVFYVANDEVMTRLYFPLITATAIGSKQPGLKCYMCKQRPPHWYTRKNQRLPVDPFFFCDECFYSFNYDQTRKKIGHFQAFIYTNTLGIPDNIFTQSPRRNH